MQKHFFPVQHLSYSAIRLLLTNPAMFQKRYIEYIWDDTKSPALVEGSACHLVIADFYSKKLAGKEDSFDKNESIQLAIQKEIEEQKESVDWGKTGSFDKSVEAVKRSIDYYFSDATIHNPFAVEESWKTAVADLDGMKMPIELKGKFDLIATDDNGELYGVDHKFVSTFSDEVKPEYKIQAVMYFLIVKYAKKVELKHVQFDEIKKSVKPAKDGNMRSHKVLIDDQLIGTFFVLLKRIINHLSVFKKLQPLPNFFDYLSGEETWNDFETEAKYLLKKGNI